MTSGRRHSNWWKRAFSVALAHFVAIQLVLGAAVAVQMASLAPAEATALCAEAHGGQPGDNGQGNVHHDICMACAFTAHATPLPGAITVAYDGRTFALALQPAPLAPAAVAQQHDPRTSQGPPLNA